MLYEDISKVDGPIVNEIFELLIDKQEIKREQLLDIFAKCNSFIIGFDDNKISKYLEENISQMIKIINISYKINRKVQAKYLPQHLSRLHQLRLVPLRASVRSLSDLPQRLPSGIHGLP